MRKTMLICILLVVMISAQEDFVDEYYQMNKACTMPVAQINKNLQNCLLMKENSDKICKICEDGYYIFNIDNSNNKCNKKMNGCKYQSEENKCEICNDGYAPRYISNSRKFDGCLNTVQNCASYNAYDDCFMCKEGFYLKENKCVADTDKKRSNCYEFDYADICIRPHIQYAFDVDYKIIDNKKTMCSKFDKSKSCEYCHYGYQLNSGSCLYIDSNLPFNWLYVTLSAGQNNCMIMYGSLPPYLKIDDNTFGCFKSKYVEDTFKDSGCKVGKFDFVNKKLICKECSTDKSVFSLQTDDKKGACVSGKDENCLYFLQADSVYTCQQCKSGFNINSKTGKCENYLEVQCLPNEFKNGSNVCTDIKTVKSNCILADQNDSNGKCLLCECEYYLNNAGNCTKYNSSACLSKQYVQEQSDKKTDEVLCYKCELQKYLKDGKCESASDKDKCDHESYQKFLKGNCETIDKCANVILDTEKVNKVDVEKKRCKRCEPNYKLKTDEKTQETSCELATDNCLLQFSNSTTCQKCKVGFTLKSGVCYEEKIANCSEYEIVNSVQKCKTCKQFYKLNADKCELADLTSLENCIKFDSNYKCLECNSLTKIVKDGKCAEKPSNNCENSFQGVCIKCISNNQKHFELGSDGVCVEYLNCAADCQESKCKAPLYGFQKGVCINSVGKVPYCLQYIQPDPKKLDIVCDSCREGYIVTEDKSQCLKSSISNCLQLTNDSNLNKQTCLQCAKSYELSEDKSACTQMNTEASSSSIIKQAYQSILVLVVIVIALI